MCRRKALRNSSLPLTTTTTLQPLVLLLPACTAFLRLEMLYHSLAYGEKLLAGMKPSLQLADVPLYNPARDLDTFKEALNIIP